MTSCAVGFLSSRAAPSFVLTLLFAVDDRLTEEAFPQYVDDYADHWSTPIAMTSESYDNAESLSTDNRSDRSVSAVFPLPFYQASDLCYPLGLSVGPLPFHDLFLCVSQLPLKIHYSQLAHEQWSPAQSKWRTRACIYLKEPIGSRNYVSIRHIHGKKMYPRVRERAYRRHLLPMAVPPPPQ